MGIQITTMTIARMTTEMNIRPTTATGMMTKDTTGTDIIAGVMIEITLTVVDTIQMGTMKMDMTNTVMIRRGLTEKGMTETDIQ